MPQIGNKHKYRRRLVTGLVTATVVSFFVIGLIAVNLLEVASSVNKFGFYSYRQIHITLLDATRLSDALTSAAIAPAADESHEVLSIANDLAYIRFFAEDRTALIAELPQYRDIFKQMESIIEDTDTALADGTPMDTAVLGLISKDIEMLLSQMNEAYYAHGNEINRDVVIANERLFDLAVGVGVALVLFWAATLGAVVLLIKRHQAAEMLQHQATHDALTGLKNRGWLAKNNETMFDRAHLTGAQLLLALIDLDRFKEVNDTYGHQVGDVLLQRVAEILMTFEKPQIIVPIRLGGDEMALIAMVADADAAQALSAALHQSLNTNVELSGHSLRLGASIGTALYPSQGGELEVLTRHADVALYRAKETGRARLVEFDPEIMGDTDEKGSIQARIREAIDAGEFELFWQPIFELKTGRLTGAEALLRWNDSVGNKVLMPGDFLPLAERSDLIYDIDRMVLLKSCAEAAGWEAEMKTDFVISVNISARNLESRSFPGYLVGLARRAGLDPKRLEIDITEDIFIADRATAFDVVRDLRDFGFRVALDDFGKGTADLEYLAELDIDRVKIDVGFIKDMHRSPKKQSLVKSIITTGQAAGTLVIAEGVEHEAQIGLLAELGCDFAQGYALAEPADSATFRKYLRRALTKQDADQTDQKHVA